MQNITIFCSASDTVAPIYKNEAETVGQWIGTHHKALVYGGANGGLMEIVAKEVRDNGSQVLGIITRHIAEMGRSSQQPTDLVTTDSMGERKRLLIERGDILVALPGGIGTIDELFDALTTKMLGTHDKPVIICNTQVQPIDSANRTAAQRKFLAIRPAGSLPHRTGCQNLLRTSRTI